MRIVADVVRKNVSDQSSRSDLSAVPVGSSVLAQAPFCCVTTDLENVSVVASRAKSGSVNAL